MEKNLLPEKEYYAWDEEMVALREKTIIASNVWIGGGAVILPGVEIGKEQRLAQAVLLRVVFLQGA